MQQKMCPPLFDLVRVVRSRVVQSRDFSVPVWQAEKEEKKTGQ